MRAHHKLTARGVEKFVREGKPGSKIGDGAGLYARKNSGGTVSWVLISTVDGRTRERGLGSIRDTTLSQARTKAADMRGAPQGGDNVPAEAVTFRDAARSFKLAFRDEWKNVSTLRQFDLVTEKYCASILDVPVDALGVQDVLRVMDAVGKKLPTQRAALSVISRIIDREIALGHRGADTVNPADARRIGLVRSLKHKTTHLPAMAYDAVPAFVRDLRGIDTHAARALELLVLTGLRINEVLGLRWDDVDLPGAVLTIPAARMKAGKAHAVPLTRRALAILADLPRDSEKVFPSVTRHALRMLVVPHGVTVHGFRASLRQFLADRTDTPRDVAEAVLAHTVQGVEAAYRREQSLAKAGAALKAWGDFIG